MTDRFHWSKAVAGVMDALVVPAFGAPGFLIRSQGWTEDLGRVDLRGQRFIVTGANAGIGLAITTALARQGAQVDLVCRDQLRATDAIETVSNSVRSTPYGPEAQLNVVLADLTDLQATRAACVQLAQDPTPIEALVHNAGALFSQRILSPQGVEQTFALHVLNPFLMTALLLKPFREHRRARVIWVSSGGMYTQRLKVRDLAKGADRFDGVVAYAQCKRAQIEVMKRMHEGEHKHGLVISAMHPGWADTRGVRESLPRFRQLTRWFLRDAAQGADTALWLALSAEAKQAGGRLYLDRVPRSEHIPWSGTQTAEEDIDALWALCERLCGVTWPD